MKVPNLWRMQIELGAESTDIPCPMQQRSCAEVEETFSCGGD